MSGTLLFSSFVAGMFSILAPCVISMVPAMMARGVDGKRVRSPLFVIGGLALSIVLFSVLLKSTTLLLGVPAYVWSVVSGSIVLLFGATMLFPNVWDQSMMRLGVPTLTQKNVASAESTSGRWGDVLLGASLGPVFSACSPTYALIVATILPTEPLVGFVYLLAYVTGLSLLMWLVVIFGRRLLRRLTWGIDPGSLFHKVVGVLLVLIGLMIVTGLDKLILSSLVSSGLFDWQITLEETLQP